MSDVLSLDEKINDKLQEIEDEKTLVKNLNSTIN